jgi:hypothetical protein
MDTGHATVIILPVARAGSIIKEGHLSSPVSEWRLLDGNCEWQLLDNNCATPRQSTNQRGCSRRLTTLSFEAFSLDRDLTRVIAFPIGSCNLILRWPSCAQTPTCCSIDSFYHCLSSNSSGSCHWTSMRVISSRLQTTHRHPPSRPSASIAC